MSGLHGREREREQVVKNGCGYRVENRVSESSDVIDEVWIRRAEILQCEEQKEKAKNRYRVYETV